MAKSDPVDVVDVVDPVVQGFGHTGSSFVYCSGSNLAAVSSTV